MSCATYSFINDSWRNGQFRHYVKSRKETVVYETVEKSRRFTGRSDHFDVPVSVSCATCSRICWHLNLTKEKERKLDLSRSFSRGSSETTRMSSGILCQPSVILNLRLDCVSRSFSRGSSDTTRISSGIEL